MAGSILCGKLALILPLLFLHLSLSNADPLAMGIQPPVQSFHGVPTPTVKVVETLGTSQSPSLAPSFGALSPLTSHTPTPSSGPSPSSGPAPSSIVHVTPGPGPISTPAPGPDNINHIESTTAPAPAPASAPSIGSPRHAYVPSPTESLTPGPALDTGPSPIQLPKSGPAEQHPFGSPQPMDSPASSGPATSEASAPLFSSSQLSPPPSSPSFFKSSASADSDSGGSRKSSGIGASAAVAVGFGVIAGLVVVAIVSFVVVRRRQNIRRAYGGNWSRTGMDESFAL